MEIDDSASNSRFYFKDYPLTVLSCWVIQNVQIYSFFFLLEAFAQT